MNYYEKRQLSSYNRMAQITLIDYKKTLAELEVKTALLDSNVDEYERLIDDIVNCKEININGETYAVSKIK